MMQWTDYNLFERIALAKQVLEPVESDYRVVFEHSIDDPVAVLVPDPNWMACALHGDILPPADVYRKLETGDNGQVLNGHILHETAPIGPMSEEEAIEYLIEKDIPEQVWKQTKGNAVKIVICRKYQLPASRMWRNAWKINQEIKNDDHLHRIG